MSYPPAVPPESRNWAVGAHLSALAAAWLALGFVGPLVVWLVKKDQDGYVAHHAREALNFQLSWLVYALVGGVVAFLLAVVTLGIGVVVIAPLAALAGVAWLVLIIVAAVKAANGEAYRYPLTIRFVS